MWCQFALEFVGAFRYTESMANILGNLPKEARRNLIGSLAARVSETARLKAEFDEGEGLRRLVDMVERLPDNVTAVLRPSLGFGLVADAVVIGPGTALVVCTLHWKGAVSEGERGEWLGAGKTDLGRPDRRAHVFATRLDFSGHARGYQVEPLVVCTEGPVDLKNLETKAPVVQHSEAQAYLAERFRTGAAGFDPSGLIDVLTS